MIIKDQEIQFLLYSSQEDCNCRKILSLSKRLFSQQHIRSFNTLSQFSAVLKRMYFRASIILILVRDNEELNNLFDIRDDLADQSLILVLPNTHNGIMRQGLRLYPRYISYMKDEYQDVFYVLEKMIGKIQQRIKGEKHVTGEG